VPVKNTFIHFDDRAVEDSDSEGEGRPHVMVKSRSDVLDCKTWRLSQEPILFSLATAAPGRQRSAARPAASPSDGGNSSLAVIAKGSSPAATTCSPATATSNYSNGCGDLAAAFCDAASPSIAGGEEESFADKDARLRRSVQRVQDRIAQAADFASLSVGSAMHGRGHCKPCAWKWKPGGCLNGKACGYCHACDEGELKRRKKERLMQLKRTGHN